MKQKRKLSAYQWLSCILVLCMLLGCLTAAKKAERQRENSEIQAEAQIQTASGETQTAKNDQASAFETEEAVDGLPALKTEEAVDGLPALKTEEAVGGFPALIQTTTFESDYQALVHLGLTATKQQETENLQEAFQKILCSCVRVQVEGHHGSGSIYRLLEDEIIVVTNRHVLQYWNEDSYVTFWNGRTAGGSILGLSEEADAGFISIPISGFTYEELLELKSVRTDQEDITAGAGTAVFLVDLATDQWSPVMYAGRIIEPKIYLQDFGMEMLYGRGTAVGGMSGSGVFDGHGIYLGMLTGGTLNEEFAAVPVDVVEEFYLSVHE